MRRKEYIPMVFKKILEDICMKIVLISGQNHKGSTYNIGRMLADKVGGEITEYFLPRDFGEFCIGCTNCFMKGETHCPHYSQLLPITQAMDEADLLIFSSPVYVLHVTGSMKAFLDHYGYRYMVHRPEEKMFHKQAVCISTAAGGGMRSTNKDIADSLIFWGIPKVYRYGVAVRAISYEGVSQKIKEKIDRKTNALAAKIVQRNGKVRPGIRTLFWFYVVRAFQGSSGVDHRYWKEKGWTGKKRPWK
jgi:multimeric flavodoxin WrbA